MSSHRTALLKRVINYSQESQIIVLTNDSEVSSLFALLCADVHGLHTHGAPGQEAEPEPSREGTRAGEGHRQHQRPQGPRPQEEREEMLLRRDGRTDKTTYRSSLAQTKSIETRLGKPCLRRCR